MDIVEEKKDDQAYGYIIKLYKKMFHAPKKATIRDAMFMTWMNFDCMDVMKVSGFREFNKSLIPSDLKEREKYESRQKLFLYSVNDEHRLLLDNQELKELPLITLSIMDLRKQTEIDRDFSLKKKLCECVKDCVKGKENVKGELYGSLSIYAYVLVLRGNCYGELAQTIDKYRKCLLDLDILIDKTYTIAGINLQYQSFWKGESDSLVSIRVSCSSKINSRYLRNNEAIKSALKEGYRIFSVMGKYDYDIVGEIKDPAGFLELFLDNGALSPANTDIHKTNTRFMNLEITEQKDENTTKTAIQFDCSAEDNIDTIDLELKEYIDHYSDLKGLCSSIRESLIRLILRLYQSKITVGSGKIKTDLKYILDCFLHFLKIHQDEIERQDEFGKMINCLNLLLDNRISASIPDFETPQNVLRYSGTSLRVLLAYSDFVDRLFSILQFYKKQNQQSLRYVPLVTTDTGAKITATVYLSYCDVYRFININIPVDLLFEVQDVLPWLTHEVGHFIRAGWKRYERNKAYFWSVSRMILHELEPYTEKISIKGECGFSEENQAPEEFEGEKFDAYQEYVCQYFQNIIYRCVSEYNGKIQVPYNRARGLFDKTKQLTVILQKIYEESVADIFMIQILKIDNLTEYLQIQSAYYQHINMANTLLPTANISRIMAVSIVIEKLDIKDYKGIQKYFELFYKTCRNVEILPIVNQLRRYEKCYMIEPLVLFLQQKVTDGLNQLLQKDPVRGICNELQKNYENLRTGNLSAFLQFIWDF